MPDIIYVLNDPTIPELAIPVNLPAAPPGPQFKVDGYRGATDAMWTLEHQAASVHYTICNAINLANRYLVAPLKNWATTQMLLVQPRAGKQLNAYYDRQALRFFYAMNPITRNLVYAVNSNETVIHELGHAILDAVRPDLYHTQAMEIWAFHESFGDIHSILNMLQHEAVLDHILKETNGDIRKSNAVTRIAEEMGQAIYDMTGGRMGHTAGIVRNAVNTYRYTEPEKLPRQGPDNQLTGESHSFSRVFTGAWYDILCGIYEYQLAQGLSVKDAIIVARDIMARYTYGCLPFAAATIRFFDAVARAMLVIDKANNYQYNEIMNKVFIARGILREVVRPMVNLNWSLFQSITEPADEIFNDSQAVMVRNKVTHLLTLPYFNINIEAPGDTYYEFNDAGECVNVITTSAQELIEHAHACVDFLHENDLIRSDKQTPFELDADGNLLRSHFACGCGCISNATLPGQPEYGKPWKSENNSGCSCNAKCKTCCTNSSTITTSSTETVVTAKLLR